MGYVFNFHDARAYERWFLNHKNQAVSALESRLMLEMLKPAKGDSVLDIGCGTGASTAALIDMGLDVTGIEPSPYMLDIAKMNMGTRADLHRGFAEDLPFDDNSFNYACFFTTLEFVENPVKALEEACRVAKDRVFIGVLNRYALKGIQRRVKGIFTSTIYNHAQFFSVWELKAILKEIAGPAPVSWRTVCQFPNTPGRFLHHVERSNLIQRIPFGTFAGIVVTLTPRFRTKPLPLGCHSKRPTGIAAG